MKIYINENVLRLVTKEEADIAKVSGHYGNVSRWEAIKPKEDEAIEIMNDIINSLEKAPANSGLQIVAYGKKVENLEKLVLELSKLQTAAGGLVKNSKGEILGIFRRGAWDMPKGKIEAGETIEETAVREVQEETGLNNLIVIRFLGRTLHTFWSYHSKISKRILKESFWYEMQTTDDTLIPQTEEDIEVAEWIKPEDFVEKTPIYSNILDVLNSAGYKKKDTNNLN